MSEENEKVTLFFFPWSYLYVFDLCIKNIHTMIIVIYELRQ